MPPTCNDLGAVARAEAEVIALRPRWADLAQWDAALAERWPELSPEERWGLLRAAEQQQAAKRWPAIKSDKPTPGESPAPKRV
jgi:hypothetical protein